MQFFRSFLTISKIFVIMAIDLILLQVLPLTNLS